MKLFFLAFLIGLISSCGPKVIDTVNGAEVTETAQQVGDMMASVDEIGGVNGGTIALMEHSKKTFARLTPENTKENYFLKLILPEAHAINCDATTGGFSTCSSNSITRTFAGCTVGGSVTFTGTVAMNWGSSALNCVLGGGADSNETITRVPNFTAQGRRDASLVVSKTGSIGQRLTWVSGSGSAKVFNFASDGINRKFTNSSNVSTFDFTSSTFGNIQITGTNRSGRVMTGGILRVRDNINNVTCDYVPTNVTWAVPACNCPSQGSWSATCTRADSSTYSTSLVINGCGIGLYTEGSSTNDVKFDRCGS